MVLIKTCTGNKLTLRLELKNITWYLNKVSTQRVLEIILESKLNILWNAISYTVSTKLNNWCWVCSHQNFCFSIYHYLFVTTCCRNAILFCFIQLLTVKETSPLLVYWYILLQFSLYSLAFHLSFSLSFCHTNEVVLWTTLVCLLSRYSTKQFNDLEK